MHNFIEKIKKITARLDTWSRSPKGEYVFNRMFFYICPIIAFCIVERMNCTTTHLSQYDIIPFILNLLLYTAGFCLLSLAFGERKLLAALYPAAWGCVGLINHYVLLYRDRILLPSDLRSWQTVWAISDKLSLKMDSPVFQTVFLFICYIAMVCVFVKDNQQPRKHWKAHLTTALLSAILAACSLGSSAAQDKLGLTMQQWYTQDNGFLVNFILMGMSQSSPEIDGYSVEQAENLIAEIGEAPADSSVTKPKNIICIMDETFMDYDVYEDHTKTGVDYTPFLHSLKDSTTNGWVISPAFGGGTALPEYEFLTWQSEAFLPYETVAYQLYVNHDMPSLASLAKQEGYTTTAFHPYHKTGWGRFEVYPRIGFDNTIFSEDDPDKYENDPSRQTLGLYSDSCDFEDLFDLTNNTSNNFIFNVTIQNHMPYFTRFKEEETGDFVNDAEIPEKLKGTSLEDDAKAYLSLLKDSDDALRALIEHYQNIDEPTMIVFFGDHQTIFASELANIYYPDKSEQERQLMGSATPFFIWTNYDSTTQSDLVLSPSILGALTAQKAGFTLPALPNYLLSDVYPEILVAHQKGIITRDDLTVREYDDLSSEEKSIWDNWATLSHYFLFGFSNSN